MKWIRVSFEDEKEESKTPLEQPPLPPLRGKVRRNDTPDVTSCGRGSEGTHKPHPDRDLKVLRKRTLVSLIRTGVGEGLRSK